jgi:hypothetical protein
LSTLLKVRKIFSINVEIAIRRQLPKIYACHNFKPDWRS